MTRAFGAAFAVRRYPLARPRIQVRKHYRASRDRGLGSRERVPVESLQTREKSVIKTGFSHIWYEFRYRE